MEIHLSIDLLINEGSPLDSTVYSRLRINQIFQVYSKQELKSVFDCSSYIHFPNVSFAILHASLVVAFIYCRHIVNLMLHISPTEKSQ
jgi:hypothetical protein